MQRRRRLWVIIGLVVMVLAACIWWFGGDHARTTSARRDASPYLAANVEPRHEPVPELGPLNYAQQAVVPEARGDAKARGDARPPNDTNISHNVPLLAYRVKNTEKPLKELIYSDSAILLRNALFDAAEPAPLQIPPHLMAQGDPGSFVVQARGPVDAAFLARLKAANATIISYIPNNAYLVRASQAAANQLLGAPETQSVLPWEPYFKLDLWLLARAVNNEPLPEGERVSVVVYPGEREAGLKALEALGGHVVGEDTSPFGHQIIIEPQPDSLAALAQLPIVQSIEPHRGRVLANDLSRVRASVTTNTLPVTPNYLGLHGSNVVVGINDTGVEKAHLDIGDTRVFGLGFDLNGHGTHVGGTIASSGQNSPTNAPGSTNGATFRGVAPASKLYSQPIDLIIGPLISDAFIQQNTARSNVFISNNSWGYPIAEYNQNAASYDAAVRDALPGREGSSPVIFVFAAGNVSNSDFDGRGSRSDQISSPGTGKNVITVGAIENLRNLTNQFQIDGQTNAYFQAETDSDDQVAYYSARGNVGVGLEGEFGRFKPDLVAPGSWLVSCRASAWRDPTNLVNFDATRDVDQFIERRGTNFYFRTIPDNATALLIRVLRNSQSPATLPRLNIHTNATNFPAVIDTGIGADFAGQNVVLISPVAPGQFFFALHNTNSIGVHFDLLTAIVTTNDFGDYFKELKALNDQLAPYYRFESGTSMAAPVVSGTLALMQEFFEQRLQRTNSPALMKALLINGARTLPCTGCGYDLQVRKPINNQGWGSIRLTNSIPRAMDIFKTDSNRWPVIMIDQSPDNALVTGESHTYEVQIGVRARDEPLMVTLVWTDPPGNPVASTKLVNDLDLIVTNTQAGGGGEYYVGNDIPQGSDFNAPVFVADSNAPPFDVVNNVENVFINDTLAQRYTVTVRARRVNVNAVTSQTNGIRQDYALVISSGNSSLTNTFNFTAMPFVQRKNTDLNPSLQSLSNKVARLDQRVGAQAPHLDVMPSGAPGPSHGITNQWNFYVFNNTNDRHTNVAFFTFLAPDLSLPRVREADIDLYVTRDPNLTNLVPAVLTAARTSLTRGGTELVILTGADAPTGNYYIGVKSEDQQAASFGIFAVAQEKPFGQRDENGNIPLEFFTTANGCIPDGSPENPGGVRFFSIVADALGGNVRRILLTNDVDHDLGGDLLGSFTSSGAFLGVPPTAVLNNHRQFNGSQRFIYDDSGEEDIPDSRKSDGPGSLRDFEGRPVNGLWQFTMVDNTPFHTGCVSQIIGLIEPQEDTNTLGNGILLTIGGNRWRYTTVDVPVGVTNLQVFIRQEPLTQLPVDVFIRRGARPNLVEYDKYGRVDPPGGVVEHGRYDFPSLQSGRYHIGLYNPNSSAVSLRMRIEFQYSLRPLEIFHYTSSNAPTRIPDDMTTNFVIGVTNARTVADVKVGVRIDHPRLSDLVLHLVSPEGTRILLTENRGLSLGTNYGEGVPVDFVVPISSDGTDAEKRISINTSNRQGIVRVNYDFLDLADTLRVYYEGKRIFDSGPVSNTGVFNVPYGPGISTIVEVVVNEGGNPEPNTVWFATISVTGPWNYAIFTDQATLGGPIKFAFPPFSRFPTNITVFSNSFENALAGLYGTNLTPTVIDTVADWGIRSNSVAIITDTNAACTGSNYLALSHGIISRGLTNIIPGHEYVLSFGHRKISSSPTQTVTVGLSFNTTPYWNLTSPPPAGAVSAAMVPKLRVCPGQDVIVISTNTVTPAGGPTYTAEGNTNDLVYGMPRNGLIGCWSSHPTILNSTSLLAGPFYIGGGTNTNGTAKSVVIAAPNEPGDYYLFLGVNDNDYTDLVTGIFIVDLRWAQCQLARAEYIIGNNATPLPGTWNTNWAGESLLFVGNPRTTNIAFRPDINTTFLLDCVVIDELIPSAYYLSEEPLAPLKSQTALGEWKLEVTDNRAGPPITTGTNFPTLLSWSLNFVFEDGPQPIGLTNGVRYSRTVRKDEMHYFVVNVPLEVNTNLITFTSTGNGGGVELLYSPSGLPEGFVPPDPIGPMGEGGPLFGVSTNFPPSAGIIPGRPYFLAIRNADPTTPANDYTIRVDFSNVSITPLVNNVPLSRTIQPLPGTFKQVRADSSMAVANMHYYYFDVGSSGDPAVSNVVFRLSSSAPANVHLVARRALPIFDLFPRPTSYEYQSTEASAPDQIIITSNSIPVKFGPGRWYLGVYNVGAFPTNYSIFAFESPNPVFTLNHLARNPTGVSSVSFTWPPGNILNVLYHFVTHQDDAAVLFEISGMNSDVDLIVRRSDLPSLDLYDFSFLSTGPNGPGPISTGYEPIPLRTNVFIPTLGPNASYGVPPSGGSGTNWFIAIVNRGTTTASGNLCVKVFNTLNPLVGCVFNARFTAPVTPGGPFDICWDSVSGTTYDVENTVDMVNWGPVITNFVATSANSCVGVPQASSTGFFRIKAY